LAKVDATKEPTSAADYGVSGYPTIFFFINGTKVDFTADRTKEAILGWVEKKVLPATKEIHTQDDLDKLLEDDAAHLVLFSADDKERNDFGVHAAADDYNSKIMCYV
jgi:protein disulfide-isomerase A1